MGIGIISILGLALAEDTTIPWYLGKEVQGVSISNLQGELPDGDLQQFLRVQVGQKLFVSDIRQDISTLYTIGEFAGVEVDILNVAPEDETPMVQIQYRVERAPQFKEVRISGANRNLQKIIVSELNLSKGQVFFPDSALDKLEKQLYVRFLEEGYKQLQIEIQSVIEDGDVVVEVFVLSAQERIISDVQVLNAPENMDFAIWWILRRSKLYRGQRVKRSVLNQTKEDITRALVDNGWVQAKVRLVIQPDIQGKIQGKEHITVIIELDKQLQFSQKNLKTNNQLHAQMKTPKKMMQILGIYGGERISPRDAKRYTETLKQWCADNGFLDASVQVEITSTEAGWNVETDVHSGKKSTIDSGNITFTGNTIYSGDELRSTFFSDNRVLLQEIYNPKEIKKGIESLKQAYIAQGYLQAEIGYTPKLLQESDTLITYGLDIQIVEHNQTQLGTVQVLGGIEAIHQSYIEPLQGAYRPKLLQQVQQQLLVAYQNKGYLYADVQVRSQINPYNNTIDVMITIEPNDLVLLRNIGVRGNQYTDITVIDSVMALEVGKPITPLVVEETRQNLYDLNIFDTVNIQFSEEQRGAQDAIVYVDERPKWAFTTGASVATDFGLLSTASIQHRNLLGLGHQATMLSQFGYSWSDNAWSFDRDRPIWRFAGQYTAKRLPFSFSTVKAETLFQEIVQEPSYRMVQSGAATGITIIPSKRLSMLVEYRVRRMRLDDYEPGLLLEQEPWSLVLAQGQDFRWWSGVQGTLVIDYRNDPFNPTEGTVLSGEARLGDGLINSLPTVRLGGNFTTIQPLLMDRVKVSMSWGIARTFDDSPVPLEDRFFLGGSNSMRGFARNQVGPANQEMWKDFAYPDQINTVVDDAWRRTASNRWVSTGGDSYVMTNIEWHHSLENIGLSSASVIAFTDIGRLQYISQQSITDSILQSTDPLFRYSMGVGLRYATVIGPIALDIGVNPSRLEERGEAWIVPNISFGAF